MIGRWRKAGAGRKINQRLAAGRRRKRQRQSRRGLVAGGAA